MICVNDVSVFKIFFLASIDFFIVGCKCTYSSINQYCYNVGIFQCDIICIVVN